MWFAGSPKSEICDERQIVLAICSAGEFFVMSISKETKMASKAAIIGSPDQALLHETVHGDTDRTCGQIDDWACS